MLFRRRSRLLRRARLWLLVGGAALIGVLYYRPVHSYVHTKDSLSQRAGEVRQLRAEKQALEQRLALAAGGATLVRRARRLGLVKPGERLFIVKGIAAWRKARHAVGSGH